MGQKAIAKPIKRKGPAKSRKQDPCIEGVRAVPTRPEIDYSKDFMVIQEIVTERTVVVTRPACPSCGAALNYEPYHIGGKGYEWYWCCPNTACESHWPEEAPEGLKAIELYGEGSTS